jgi:hypothetical protein
MGMGDRVMGEVCAMISSLPNIEELDLRYNAITAIGFKMLSKCLKRRQKKLKRLVICGNEGEYDDNVVKELKEVCETVVSPHLTL